MQRPYTLTIHAWITRYTADLPAGGADFPQKVRSWMYRPDAVRGVDPLSDFDMTGPLNGRVRMARCRNHTRSRHSKVCAHVDPRRPPVPRQASRSTGTPPSPSATPFIRRRNHHDRKLHPSYDRGALPASRGRRDRGRRRPAAHRLRRPDREQRRRQRATSRRAAPRWPTSCPQSIRDKGVIKVGSDIAYAPVEFKDDSGKTVGIDPDLADALGKQLGVKFEFENGTFDTLITGLRSKRYDIAMSAMTDTKDRQEGSTPTRARRSARASTSSTTSPPASPSTPRRATTKGIKTWSDLCGKKLVVQRGTVSEDLAKAETEKCPARQEDLHPGVRQRPARPRPACTRAAPTPAPPTSRWPRTRRRPPAAARTSRWSASRSRPRRTASRSPRRTRSSATPSKAALDAIIKNGEYEKIIDKWGVAAGAVTEAKINGGN